MDAQVLKERLMDFALRIIRLADSLPATASGKAIARQIVRSGTSPGANYRAACLGKSEKDFLNKLKMVEEELDETAYWLEMITRSGMVDKRLLADLQAENDELLRIIVRSIITTKKRMNNSQGKNVE